MFFYLSFNLCFRLSDDRRRLYKPEGRNIDGIFTEAVFIYLI